jgi:hypothetical protein
MASEYEWLDRYDNPRRALDGHDVAWSWAVYVLLVIYLVAPIGF